MRWPWSRKVAPVREPSGKKAHHEATEHLEAARRRGPEVKRVSASLRELRERNGFGEQLTYIFGDKR